MPLKVKSKRSVKRKVYRKKRISKLRRPNMISDGRVYMKLHNTFDARSGTPSSGVSDYWVLFSLMNPENGIIDINGNITPLTTNWDAYATLYQYYKVHGISVKFIPLFNTSEFIPGDSYLYYRPMYECTDYSVSYSTIISMSDMLGYNNLKIHNMLRPIRKYTRVPIYNANPSSDGTNALPILHKGWYDTDFTTFKPPAYGYTIFRSQLTVPDTSTTGAVFGKWLVTYYVEFKYPRHLSS